MPGFCCTASKRTSAVVALVVSLGSGSVLAQVPAKPQQGPPHTGLIKTAIFTRVYGKPTIPHIVKLIAEPKAGEQTQPANGEQPQLAGTASAATTRHVSSMPVIGRVSSQTGQLVPPVSSMPNALPPAGSLPDPSQSSPSLPYAAPTSPYAAAPAESLALPAAPAQEYPTPPATNSLRDLIQATDDVISPNYGHRTFSYHDPWYSGTVAGSYPPTFFASYPSYYAGYSPASMYGPWFGTYGSGYSPYTAYAPYSFGYGPFSWGGYPWVPGYRGYLGAFGSWYGYRPWTYPSYFTGLFGPVNYGMPPFTFGPGLPNGFAQPVPWGPTSYAGCYYW